METYIPVIVPLVAVSAVAVGGFIVWKGKNLWARSKSLEEILRHSTDQLPHLLVSFLLGQENKESPLFVGEITDERDMASRIISQYAESPISTNSNEFLKLQEGLKPIAEINKLYQVLEQKRKDSFSADNQDHVNVLINHWNTMYKNDEFQINSKNWTNLGFQGTNPCSDFRAGGLLSAENLSRFAQRYPKAYTKSLEIANADATYVPHAIVGIHVTMFIMQLFKEGLLHHHFLYTSCSEMEYENLYCFIFYKLILFWIASKPENVFAYNPIEDKFFNLIRKQIVQQSGLVYTQKEFDSTMP